MRPTLSTTTDDACIIEDGTETASRIAEHTVIDEASELFHMRALSK